MTRIPIVYGLRQDPHLQSASAALKRRGVDLWFYDPSLPGAASLACDGTAKDIRLDVVSADGLSVRTVNPKDAFVWVRNKAIFANIRSFATQINRLKVNERGALIRGIIEAECLPHMNPVWDGRRQEDKVVQLLTAQRLGIRIPPTLVSSDKATIATFVAAHGACIAKPLQTGWIPEAKDGSPHQVFTPFPVHLAQIEARPEIDFALAPVIYQPYVNKAYELRIVCSLSGAVCYRIDPPATDQGRLDWRLVIDDCKNTLVPMPPDLEESLTRYLKATRLVYGVFDVVCDQQGDLFFLECNTDGQWAWLEIDGGPIADLFATTILDQIR